MGGCTSPRDSAWLITCVCCPSLSRTAPSTTRYSTHPSTFVKIFWNILIFSIGRYIDSWCYTLVIGHAGFRVQFHPWSEVSTRFRIQFKKNNTTLGSGSTFSMFLFLDLSCPFHPPTVRALWHCALISLTGRNKTELIVKFPSLWFLCNVQPSFYNILYIMYNVHCHT